MTKNKLKDEGTTMIRVYKFRAKKLAEESFEKDITVADLVEEDNKK